MTYTDDAVKSNYQRYKPIIWLFIVAAIIWAIIAEAPPTKISIEAGPRGGFFDSTALLLKEKLKEHNIDAIVINSEQTSKIISNVNDSHTKIDIGFIAHEVKPGQFPNVKSLGSIIMDPLFIFQRKELNAKSPADFRGMKLGVGPVNTGGRIITDIILKEYGITPENASYVELSLNAMVTALNTGKIDVGFFLQPTNNEIIDQVGTSGLVKLVSIEHAPALIKKNGFLHHLTIDRGAFNLMKELPSTDIQMLGVPVTVIAKENLHPAIVTLVSLALKDAFRGPTLVSNRGAFPSMEFERDLNIDPAAEKIYKNGTGYVPFLYRIFNFWVAGVLDQIALFLSFLLTIYFFFYYLGVPKPFEFWKNGRSIRRIRALERLKLKAARGPLSKRDLRKIQKIEEFFTSSSKSSQKASHLITEIKSQHQ
jgi:TRAP-type uncharacterized transport system substrate-binding protein